MKENPKMKESVMKKICCYGVGLLMAFSFIAPRHARGDNVRGLSPVAGGHNMLFNFNPVSLFFILPSLGQIERAELKANQSETDPIFTGPFLGVGPQSQGQNSQGQSLNTANARSANIANISVANLSPQEFSKNLATALFAFNQQSQAKIISRGAPPFFITAFFQTLGLTPEQIPFVGVFRLNAAFSRIDTGNFVEFAKSFGEIFSLGSSRSSTFQRSTQTDYTDTNTNTLQDYNYLSVPAFIQGTTDSE